MTIGHTQNPVRKFKPTLVGGGSQKGKPQFYWPLLAKVVADAILVRRYGSMEAMIENRDGRGNVELLRREVNRLMPNFWEWVEEQTPRHKTDPARLLCNRVYKGYYSGTSDRGPRHDPKTRAKQSREHWTSRVPAVHTYRQIHAGVVMGTQDKIDWRTMI